MNNEKKRKEGRGQMIRMEICVRALRNEDKVEEGREGGREGGGNSPNSQLREDVIRKFAK